MSGKQFEDKLNILHYDEQNMLTWAKCADLGIKNCGEIQNILFLSGPNQIS